MLLENSPFSGPVPALKSSDLIAYGHKFKQIALKKIPTSKEILLVTDKDVKSIDSNLSDAKARQVHNKVFARKIPVCLEPDKIMLPLDVADRDDLAVLVTGIDRLVVERTSTQWLKDCGSEIVGEFIAARNAVLDPLTSLYNVAGFNDFMAGVDLDDNFYLVLAESLPSAKSVKDAVAHLSDTARLLKDFNRFSFPLFHLGQSIFCFVVTKKDNQFVKTLCHSLTSFARNGGLRKVHIGFSRYNARRHKKKRVDIIKSIIMDEAWNALQRAGRRGPYAFCDYELLINPDIFPLKPVSKSTISKIAYRIKGFEKFSAIFFKPDFKDQKIVDAFILDYIGREIHIVDPDGYLVIRPGKGDKETKKWAESLIGDIKNRQGEHCSMSAGISSYPFRDYKKSEIIRNCQKALLHGSFYGPGSSVVFDSLSLNVSGDAYFGESDLSGAVREYRKGLEIDPQDVNLLNSLGVTNALMNRTAKAQETFRKVLDIEPNNFMALFNKGLGEKNLKHYEAAVQSFSRALESYNKNDAAEAAVINDLQYQLGVCLYQTGNYQASINVLKRYHKSGKNQAGHERCFRYIGISYYFLHSFRQAAKWLQRGLSANQSDAEALSLLGMVYLETGEGDEIALKICEKSVEIDPDKPEYKIRYGRALTACKRFDSALEIFHVCARFKEFRAAAWLEIARIHVWRNDPGSGTHYLRKIFNGRDIDPKILEDAGKLQKKLNKVSLI